MNHDERIKWRITRSIARCPWIPAERDKRAKKVAGYIETEQEREKHPEQTARTIRDLQEQVQHLQAEVLQRKKRANEGILGRIRRKRG